LIRGEGLINPAGWQLEEMIRKSGLISLSDWQLIVKIVGAATERHEIVSALWAGN
jgi:hypothetical protein